MPSSADRLRVCACLALVFLCVGLVPGCKSKAPPPTSGPAPAKVVLGFALDAPIKVFVTARGHQESSAGRRAWQMSSSFALRLTETQGVHVLQESLAPWQGKLAPAVFAGITVVHAIPRINLDPQGHATGFDGVAGLASQVQGLVDKARARLDDPTAVLALAGDGQRLAAELDRFWNHLWLAHQRAGRDFVPGSEKIHINDPVLGPGSIVNIEAGRSERACAASDGGGTCLQTQLTLRPDKVTVLEATRKLAGLLPSEASVTAYNVEDRLVLLTRTKDLRVLEFTDERRTRTTASLAGGKTADVRDFEQRHYRFSP